MTWVLGILKFFSSVWSMLWSLITKYPIQCLMVIAVCVLLWFTNKWAVERTTTKLNKEHAAYVQKVEQLADAREKRIKEVEDSSKKAGEEAQAEIATTKQALEDAKLDYELRLKTAASQKKIEYVYVKVPGAKETSTELIVENGVVACRRLPSQFGESINLMVDKMNGVPK